jgi:hypothetical protein
MLITEAQFTCDTQITSETEFQTASESRPVNRSNRWHRQIFQFPKDGSQIRKKFRNLKLAHCPTFCEVGTSAK